MMEVTLRESSVETASPRRSTTSVPRDADDPATTRNKERGARPHAAEASAPRDGSPVACFDLERNSARREAEAEPATPHKKARIAQQEAGKASASRMGSPVPWFHPESYGEDLWTEVAKHISGSDLICLSGACRWLFQLLADDSIWRYAFFRELQLLGNNFSFGYTFFRDLHDPDIELGDPCHTNCYWRQLYIANELHSSFDSNNESGLRGFIVKDSDLLLTARLPSSLLSLRHAVESMGTCILTNARHGVWIVDMQVTECLGCGIADCEGSVQVLEAHHCELLLEESVQHVDLGQYLVDKGIDNAFCGFFNSEQVDSLSTAGVVNISSWIGDQNVLLTRQWRSPYAAAMKSYVQGNKGLLSLFEALRDNRKGQAVCARIVQRVVD